MFLVYSIVLPVLLQNDLEECEMGGVSAQLEEAATALESQKEEPKLLKARISGLKLSSQDFRPLQEAVKDFELIRDLKALASKIEGNDDLKKEMQSKIAALEKSLTQKLANSFGMESVLRSIDSVVPVEDLKIRLEFDQDMKKSDAEISLFRLNTNALVANQPILEKVDMANVKKSTSGSNVDVTLPMLEHQMTYLAVVKPSVDSKEARFVMFTTAK